MQDVIISGRPIPGAYIAAAAPALLLIHLAGGYYSNALGYYGFFGNDWTTNVAQLDSETQEVDKQRQELEELKKKIKDMDSVKSETEALLKRISLKRQRVPSEAQVSVLLFDLERMARSSEGRLLKFTPEKAHPYGAPPGFVAPPPQPVAPGGKGAAAPPVDLANEIDELPITVSTEVSYNELIHLLSQLNKYERTLNISNIKLTPKTNGTPTFIEQPTIGSTVTPNLPGAKVGSRVAPPSTYKNLLGVDFTISAYILRASR